MLDANFRSYVIVAAALVMSPGATMAVVTDMALAKGRLAALLTVAGVNIANSTLALASALGMSAVLHQWPSLLRVISIAGAVYLTYLGLRTLWRTLRTRSAVGGTAAKRRAETSPVALGILTNLLNPAVVLFYMLVLPRFIASTEPFFQRFLLLAATHVSMSLVWLTGYAFAVGTVSERLAHPQVRTAMEILTGSVLVLLGARLLLR